MKEPRINIPIQKVGSYFELDENGYVINPTGVEKIQEEWKSALDNVVEVYKKEFRDNLTHVYVRGSVARGTAVKEISDIDTFAYVKLPQDDISSEWISEPEKAIVQKYPFIQGAEFSVSCIEKASNDAILLTQSLCLYNNGLALEVQKLKPGRDLVLHAPGHVKRLNNFKKRFENFENEEVLKEGCLWLMKEFLRTGFELTMERSHTYTRDLYPCYETFSRYYLEKEPVMREILNLALNPTTNKQKLENLMKDFGEWIAGEIDVQFPDLKKF